jgi:exopolysaccharide production protein ExoZ
VCGVDTGRRYTAGVKKPPRTVKFNDIQWLRAVAALEVAIWHSDLVTKNFSNLSVASIDWYRPLGGLGVEVFFIVSGYVMCLRLPSYKSGAQFMYGRIARLAPMYWIFTSLVIAAFLLNPSWRLNELELSARTIVLSYLMLPQQRYPILGVGWSLEIEMIFYATLAVALSFASALMRRPGNAIVYPLVLVGLVGLVLGTGPVARVWDYHLLSPYLLLFAFGWAICNADRWQMRSSWAKMLAATALIWIVALATAESSDRYLVLRMAVAGGIFLLARILRPIFQRGCAINHVGSVLGDASYSLYLSHWFVLSGLGKIAGAVHPPATFDWEIRLVAIGAAIVFACACFRYAEAPLDRLLRPRVRRLDDTTTLPQPQPHSSYFVVPLEMGATTPNVTPPMQHDSEDGKWR